jgi:hypothetical protein
MFQVSTFSIFNTAFRARVAVFLALADSTPLVDPISVLRNLIPIKMQPMEN